MVSRALNPQWVFSSGMKKSSVFAVFVFKHVEKSQNSAVGVTWFGQKMADWSIRVCA